MPALRQAPFLLTWYYGDYRLIASARSKPIQGVLGVRYRHVEERRSHEQDGGIDTTRQGVDHR